MEAALWGARLILDEVEGSTTLDCRESGANGYGSPRAGGAVGIVWIGACAACSGKWTGKGVKEEENRNDEIRMTNDEWGTQAIFIRHSDFVIRHFLRPSAEVQA